MKLTFTKNSPPDMALFRRACRKRPKSAKRKFGVSYYLAYLLLNAVFAAGAIVLSFVVLRGIGATDQQAGMFGPLAGATGAFALAFFTNRVRGRLSAFPYVAGEETEYQLSADGVSVSCAKATVQLDWAGVQGFAEGAGGLFFYHGAIVLVIPDEALGDRRVEAVTAIRDWYVAP